MMTGTLLLLLPVSIVLIIFLGWLSNRYKKQSTSAHNVEL